METACPPVNGYGGTFPGIKLSECGVDLSVSSDKVTNNTFIFPICYHGVDRDNFIFLFICTSLVFDLLVISLVIQATHTLNDPSAKNIGRPEQHLI